MGILDVFSRIKPLSGVEEAVEKYNEKSMIIKGAESRVHLISSEWKVAKEYFDSIGDTEREDECWRLYRAFYGDQWPTDAVAKLEEEGRNIIQLPFVRQKIDGLTGSIIKNWYDIDFVPQDGNVTDLTRIAKGFFYRDKDLLNWGNSYRQVVLDGLVYRGIEQQVISRRYSPLGNIGFERIMPGHLITDPNWLTCDDWDLKVAYKIAYLTPQQIMEIYDHKTDDIRRHIEFMASVAQTFDNGNTDKGYPHYGMDSIYSRKYRVIEKHHLENEKVKVEMDIATGTIIPKGTDEEKRDWCILNQISCSDGVVEIPYTATKYFVTSCCPELDHEGLLEDREAEMQLGRLPFHIWSAAHINGRPSGIVDLIKDVQQTLNKRESLLDHIIATSANGALGIDPNLFNGDIYETNKLKKNINNPSHKFVGAPGSAERKNFIEVPRSKFPTDVVNELNRMIDYFDRLSKQPAVSDARSEGDREPGVLYARKQAQAEIVQTTLANNLEQLWNNKGETYLLAIQTLYAGAYREFKSPVDNVTYGVNQEETGADGRLHRINDISKLSRHNVVVSQSPQGLSIRTTDRIVSNELLQTIPPEYVVSRARLTKRIMETLDISEIERRELKKDAELEHALALERVKTEIMGLQVQQAQLQSQLQMANQGGSPIPDQPIQPQEAGRVGG